MSGRDGRGRGGRGGGRGEYYKNKYGRGGGRGRGGGGRSSNDGEASKSRSSGESGGGSFQDLIAILTRIDNRSYPAYHDIESFTKGWTCNDIPQFQLFIGRAQSDPFARPTACRIVVPSSSAKFPPFLHQNNVRAIALADYINRAFFAACHSMGADQSTNGQGWSGAKGGDIQICEPTQHILKQSAVSVDPSTGYITAQITVNLPAQGRTILGEKAIDIFRCVIPLFVQKSLVYSAINPTRVQNHVLSVEDQHWLRNQLSVNGLVAFVPNGAVLPRASGSDDRPMQDSKEQKVVRFQAPDSMTVSFVLPNLKTSIKGMGMKKGVNLIVGGGFHGKSTLLSALQLGVYAKIPGDGREFCVCDEKAVKIRAEDGRSVTSVNITNFISNLPFGKQTDNFTSMDASGSTSQASNIIEALEVGATTLLVDEDTCATNFMIRDEKMMELVSADKEPITPFVKKIRSLYEDRGISSILVIGGSGDYFGVSDSVIMMTSYECSDVTKRAKEIARKGGDSATASNAIFRKATERRVIGNAFRPNSKVGVRSKSLISYGDIELDLSGLEQIVVKGQTEAIAHILQMLPSTGNNASSLYEMLSDLADKIDSKGFNEIDNGKFHGGMAMPRIFEIAGAINRLRCSGSLVQK